MLKEPSYAARMTQRKTLFVNAPSDKCFAFCDQEPMLGALY